jgi:phenylacetate-CoA ligase
VVDPATGVSLPNGEMGHVVLTTIGLDANLVRFDLEDLGTLDSSPCPCGRTGPRLRVFGRSADALTFGSRTVLPVHVQGALDDHGAPEFQVHLDESRTHDRLVVSVEWDGTAAEVEAVLAGELGVPATVRTISPGSLPRASFKPRRTA